jgi:hypothetical protein
MELRCPNGIKFGELSTEFIEVKCRSKRCGAKPGIVVLHRFTHSGELVKTLRFRDPAFRKEVTRNGKSSLRSA